MPEAPADSWGESLAHLRAVCKLEKDLNLKIVEQSRLLLQRSGVASDDVLELTKLCLGILKNSTDDVEPLIRLLTQAIEIFTFDQLRSAVPVHEIIEGLSSPSSSVQSLSLSYLKKAAESPSGAASVANDTALVKALISTFFTGPADVGGIQALGVISSLLSVDNPEQAITVDGIDDKAHATGQGLLWRRIFQDEETYNLFFQFTSNDYPSSGMNRSAITTAQARLLDLVPNAANMRWDVLHDQSKSGVPMTHERTVEGSRESSLLIYAALSMVDRSDPLMTNIHVDFLTRLLALRNPGGCSSIASIPAASSPALDFLIATGFHVQATDYYLRSGDFDPSEIQFLEGAHTRYICQYAELYPEHLLGSTALARGIVQRLNNNLQISGARWAHGPSPVQDLSVMAHLPATVLLEASHADGNPLMHLPTNPANVDAFETLGRMFSGRSGSDTELSGLSIAQSDSSNKISSAVAARSLFYQYHDSHPEFWSNVGAAMNVLAMPRAASAALGLVGGILNSVWARSGHMSEPNSPLLSEEDLKELCGGNVSETGIAEVLNAGEHVIQSLLTPLQTVGGDAEAAKIAWRLGMKKWNLIQQMNTMIKEGKGKAEVTDLVWQSAARRVQERVALGSRGGSVAHTNLIDSISG